jgi:hypothetical protein
VNPIPCLGPPGRKCDEVTTEGIQLCLHAAICVILLQITESSLSFSQLLVQSFDDICTSIH